MMVITVKIFFFYNYFYKYLEDLSFLYALYTGN